MEIIYCIGSIVLFGFMVALLAYPPLSEKLFDVVDWIADLPYRRR